ncbi:MAG: DUF481 domain-containing protein [Pseudomonadota bacterium]|nr:DUF481 domain-containing protein [Pseudomonadota bacterium]
MSHRTPNAIAALLALVPMAASAEATVKPDGEFRYALGAGASYSAGNTSDASVNLEGDGVRATADSKWRFGAKGLWTRSQGTTTAEMITAGTQYERDLTPLWFGFGNADYLRDKFANIASRYSLHAGAGRHLVKRDDLTFDVSAGLGYTQDEYINQVDVHGRLRSSYGRPELLLAEESHHKLTATTSFRQKASLFPALSSSGGYRAVFDTGLAVSMTPRLSLNVGLTYRYDSDPGAGLRHNDTLFVTGIALKID